ncbi:alpha/beta fold hydrolase [Microbacterium sp. P04]|uniref:alpha/beta fold hydrolase n=1 Tax=Microbacterium sp. P04 TaxID=3366947 RepID=UPI003745E31A
MPFPFPPLTPALVTVGGRRVEVFDVGASTAGEPVIVLLTGAGDTVRSWLPVQTLLSRQSRVLAYERAGIGASEPGPPRTLEGFLAELDAVLAATAPDSHVLLVGHSFGALLARVYAARHPERVAGLVLLDATPETLQLDVLRRPGYRLYVGSIATVRRLLPGAVFGRLVSGNVLPYYPGRGPFWRQLGPAARRDWERAVHALFVGEAVAEMRAVLPGATAAAREFAADGASLGDLPVALVTSGTYGRGWIRLHDAVAARYPRATHELSGDRFHNIHMRHADRVVNIVRDMLADATEQHPSGETGSHTPEETP